MTYSSSCLDDLVEIVVCSLIVRAPRFGSRQLASRYLLSDNLCIQVFVMVSFVCSDVRIGVEILSCLSFLRVGKMLGRVVLRLRGSLF